MKVIGGILFVAGVLCFVAYFVSSKVNDPTIAMFGCLLMPGGILFGYLGSRAVKKT